MALLNELKSYLCLLAFIILFSFGCSKDEIPLDKKAGKAIKGIESIPKIMWKVERENTFVSSSCLNENIIFFGAKVNKSENYILGFDSMTGEEKLKISVDQNIFIFNMKVLNELIYFVGVAQNFPETIFREYSGYLYAVNLKTGENKWKADYGGSSSDFILSENNLFIPSIRGIEARDPIMGGKKWYCAGNKGAYISTPVIFENNILFSDLLGTIHAVNKDNGKINWVYHTISEIMPDEVIQPVIDLNENMLFIGNPRGIIRGIDVKTRLEKWKFETGVKWVTDLKIGRDGNLLFWGASGGAKRLFALDASTGQKKWSFDTLMPNSSPSLVVGNNVYFWVSNFKSPPTTIYALNIKNGEKKWEYVLGDIIGESSIAPIISNGIMYVAGNIYVNYPGVFHKLDGKSVLYALR